MNYSSTCIHRWPLGGSLDEMQVADGFTPFSCIQFTQNMKNKLWNLRNVLYVATLLLPIAVLTNSCDRTSVDNFSSSVLMKSKWTSHEAEFNEYSDWAEYVQHIWTFYFTSTSEGILVATDKWIDSSGIDDEGYDTSNIFFTYTVSGNTVTCLMENGTTYRLVYEDGCLTMGDSRYTPATPSSGDQQMIGRMQEEHQYRGNYEMDYQIGFDNKLYPTIYNKKTKTYEHHIFMGFGVLENTYLRGISEFGIALNTSEGTVDNKSGMTASGVNVSVHKIMNQSLKCFTHMLSDNKAHMWNAVVTVTSKYKTVSLDYRCIFYAGKKVNIDYNYFDTDGSGYVYSKNAGTETYTPARIVDEEGNQIY